MPSESGAADASQWLEAAVSVFHKHKTWGERAIVQVSDEQLHQPLHDETNCIAVIVKHIAGNLRSRWTDFLASDGEKPWRDRDDEFIDTLATRSAVMAAWEQGWACLFSSLQSLGPAALGRTVEIRGEPHSVALAVQRSLAHCSYHVGQIVQIARILAGPGWQTITIPRGGSTQHNAAHWGKDYLRDDA